MRFFFYRFFFMIFPSVRGEGPKSPKSGFLKMSRKRVFRKNPIVQGPGFSCKPNIAFFMGYPLYRGGMGAKKISKVNVLLDSFTLLICFGRL